MRRHNQFHSGKGGWSRRQFASVLVGTAANAWGQGMASRSVTPSPRGKPSGLPVNFHFTDVADQAGLRQPVIYGGTAAKPYILETVGCGVAFIDFDNDGWQDIFILGGTTLDGSRQGTNRLYRNNRDGTFSDVTERAGLTRTGWSSAVTVGDYNNDGYEDLFITYWGENVLYRNNGDGTFTDVTKEAGLITGKTLWGSGCAFLDYDRDGLLDLFVGSYLEFDLNAVPKPGANPNCSWKGVPVNCGPRGLPPGSARLYRNNGDGTFTDVSAKSGVSNVKGSYLMTAVAADFDNDNWPDIYVACDSSPSILLRNKHDGTFSEIALESGVAFNEDGNEQAGMGLGIGDFNLDGSLDIFKTHFADDTNTLYRNNKRGDFEDVTINAGLGVETRFVGWGAGLVDFDNDGNPELFYVSGNLYPAVAAKFPQYPLATPRVVYRNLGNGHFEELIEEAGPGIASAHCSRGCAFGDFDNDGDIDIVIVNLNEPPSLLRNDVTGGNNWLKVRLVGVKSNRSAIGARVTARYGGKIQAQEVLSQASFYSANDRRLHFGVGKATSVDLDIRWPNGGRETITGVAPNQIVEIREGNGKVAERFTPSRL